MASAYRLNYFRIYTKYTANQGFITMYGIVFSYLSIHHRGKSQMIWIDQSLLQDPNFAIHSHGIKGALSVVPL